MARYDPDALSALLEGAAALPSDARAAYVDQACGGNDDLRETLESLLVAHDAASGFFERIQEEIIHPALAAAAGDEASGRWSRKDGLCIGQRFGHYEIGPLLGRGGTSEVWEAKDLDTGRHVALKTLGWRLHSAADHARFLGEGRLAARVNHPNIVYVFGTEEIEGVPVIAMELASGGTLKDLVAADGPMSPVRAVDVMLQVIAGLQAASVAGVLHRDVKPSNCFVDGERRIQVGDFGIASAMVVHHETTRPRPRGALGTPAFASPEQLRGAALDVRSDIYAVGATLYFLLTGRPPFDDANMVRLIDRVLHERPVGVRALRRDVSRGLDRIIRECLAKDPAHRPPSYAHLVGLLLPHGSASPLSAPLGLRVLAFIIDGMIVRFTGGVLPFLVLMQWRQQVLVTAFEWLAFLGAHSLLLVGYFGVSEAVWSASPGKMAVGLRVIRTGGQPLGLCRALARAFLWWLSLAPALFIWIALWPSELGTAAWSTGWPVYVGMAVLAAGSIGILFATARRQNGFAGIHDLATQTRVVSKVAAESTAARRSLESPPVVPTALTRLGPYMLLDESGPLGVAVGYDEQLARRVWIRRVTRGTPPVSLARRNVRRPTRLRWLTGSRDTDGGWDAYEATSGESLRTASQAPMTWAVVRGWLQDIAEETNAAGDDGTDLPLAVERIWLSEGRAKLVDWPPDGAGSASSSPELVDRADVHGTQCFLYDVAMLGLRRRPSTNRTAKQAPQLPLHAREFLDDLASDRFVTTASIVERLRLLATRPADVTRARRGAHLAICGAAPLLSIAVLVPVLVVLLPLLAQSPDALLLETCLRRLASLQSSSSAEAARERAAIETYLVGRFRPLLTESTSRKPWFWPMIEMRQSTVQRALENYPNPSARETERAAQQLGGLLGAAQRNRELAAKGLLGWRLMLGGVLLLIVICAVLALSSAFVARGGAVFRSLGLGVVGPDGCEVSRWRGFARALIAWTPAIAAFVFLLPVAARDSLEEVPVAQLAPSLVLLVVFVAGVVFALLDAERGLQDRIVRTSLVAR